MSNSKLAKPRLIQLELDQEEALDMLKSLGFDRVKFIRLAIDEKLYRDYRKVLKDLRSREIKDKDVPDFAKH